MKLGVVDTLTGGQLARDLIESGYSDLVTTDLSPANLTEALKDSGADASNSPDVEEARSHAVSLAEQVTPPGGIGLAMIGPFEDSSTFIAMNGPGKRVSLNGVATIRIATIFVGGWLSKRLIGFAGRCWDR